jgi:fructose-1,6-bisphosphatase I
MSETVTLGRFILSAGAHAGLPPGDVASLLAPTAFAAKVIAREVRRAALVGRLGLIGEKNPTGDAQKKLDVFANQVFLETFAGADLIAGIVSEELEAVKQVTCNAESAYILCVDPLDGSSNSDNNGPVGTIFGFFRRQSTCGCDAIGHELREGARLVAAGYVMYGPSTVLAYTVGNGVNAFTLDHDLGEFLLSHERMDCPAHGQVFSANLGHFPEWDPAVRAYATSIMDGTLDPGERASFRYAGALVADLHRILLEGGIYVYPADHAHPKGKLRLLYECAPAAFLAEQAGGRASTGRERILDLQPVSLHDTAPLAIGSHGDVIAFEHALAASGAGQGNRDGT